MCRLFFILATSFIAHVYCEKITCQLLERDIQFDPEANLGVAGDRKIDCMDPDTGATYELSHSPPGIDIRTNPWVTIANGMINKHRARIDIIAGGAVTEIEPPPGRRSFMPSRRATTGPRRTLVVRVKAADASTTASVNALSNFVFGTSGDSVNLRSQYLACSDNQLDFEPFEGEINGHAINGGATEIEITETVAGKDDGEIRNAVTAALRQKFYDPTSSLQWPGSYIDHVMYCLPAGTTGGWIAYAYVNSDVSVYNNQWCTYVSAQMHEIGHNLGLAHSNENGDYKDQTGMMGFSYSSDNSPVMCFNNAKNYQLGWYAGCYADITTNVVAESRYLKAPARYTIAEKCATNEAVVMKVVVQGGFLFIGYNEKVLENSGTREAGNQVTVQFAEKDGAYTESELLAKMNVGAKTVHYGIHIQYCEKNNNLALVAVGDLPSPCGCTTDVECDNGDFCDGMETCANGQCVAGTPPCEEGTSCQLDTCVDVDECAVPSDLQTYGPASSIDGNTAGWNVLITGSRDDASARIGIPFAFGNFQDIYVGSNSYITFGSPSTAYRSFSSSNPPTPTLFVGGADNSFQLVLERSIEEQGVRGHVLRFEGTASTSGSVGSPNIVWEATFFESGQIRIRVLQHARSSTGIFALSDGQGGWIQEDTGIAEGWLWYDYFASPPRCDTNAVCDNTVGSFTCTCNAGYSGDGVTCSETTDVNECSLGTDNCDANAACTNTDGSFTCACNDGFAGDGLTCTDENECTLGSDGCDNNADCSNTIGSFTCTCQTGYTGVGVTCNDVDECASMDDNCGANAACTNTDGSFTCACNDGFAGDGLTCADEDECTLGSDDCNNNADCSNTIGSFTCTCQTGYLGNGLTCTDVDECASEDDNCGANAACTNTDGSFTCACNDGFAGDGLTCADEDECALGSDGCDNNANCSNTIGSFSCQCNSGYFGNGTTCADKDECSLGTDNCADPGAACTNIDGSFACACNDGFAGDGLTCADKDECVLGSDDCYANADCSNTIGSFTCTCQTGYLGNGLTCTDVDECVSEDDNCGANAACTNTDGSFTCACQVGFAGDGLTCADEDECALGSDGCDNNADCSNTIGSFSCQCNSGYFGNGTTCADEDECSLGTDNCADPGAACTNIDGSFSCACNDGFAGDGLTCADKDECVLGSDDCPLDEDCLNTVGSFTCGCEVGYSGDGLTCNDVDECASADDNCDANADCTNTNGSFTCHCQTGYTGVGVICNDVDECASMDDNCGANADCTNTDGSFTCACQVGFAGDGLTCADEDECALGSDGCDNNANCSNTIGSFSCQCNSGYFGNGTTCADKDECSLGTDNCADPGAACTNIDGSFTCTCQVGFAGDGLTCANEDECVLGSDDCDVNADCSNTIGSFTCTCQTGYLGNGLTCTDVDECASEDDNCGANAACTNTDGSFTCACNDGFAGDGLTCADEDECALGSDGCDNNANCSNTVGSYMCACSEGYSGDGLSCLDVDECAAKMDTCTEGTVCENTDGSFTCGCASGFQGLTSNSWYAGLCAFADGSHPNADFSDVTMRVAPGAGVGFGTDVRETAVVLVSKVVFPMPAQDGLLLEVGGTTNGFWAGILNGRLHIQAGDSSTMVVDGERYAGTSYLILLPGAFPADGKEHTVIIDLDLSNKGRIRLWIDAAFIAEGVNMTEGNTNWAGSDSGAYGVAATSAVVTGGITTGWAGAIVEDLLIYTGTPRVGGCLPDACSDIDECALGTDMCDANAACNNTIGSYTCACSEGYSGDGGSCSDVDECAAGAHSCKTGASCTNTDGSFTCGCAPGFQPSGSSWYGNQCYFEDETEAAPAQAAVQQAATASFSVATSIRQADAIFVAKAVFPSPAQDGMLFEVGASGHGFWAGILNGNFHIQGGRGGSAVSNGMTYSETSYLILAPGAFPADGEEHTVIIDYELSNRGRIRLWIDSSFVAEGVQMTSGASQWAGGDAAAYGDTATKVVSGGILTAWAGAIVEDLLIYTGTPRVGGCLEAQCIDADECALGTHSCNANQACINTVGSYTCSCSEGYSGDGLSCSDVDECAAKTDTCTEGTVCENTEGSFTCRCAPGFELLEDSWYANQCFFEDGTKPDPAFGDVAFSTAAINGGAVDNSIRQSDAIFVSRAVFPTSAPDGLLFEIGGSAYGFWAGILNGNFHVQGGVSSTPVVDGQTYTETSYLIVAQGAFPADGEEHTVIIDYALSKLGRIRLWIDNTFVAEGVAMMAGTSQWAGSDSMSYGIASTSGIVRGGTTTGWAGAIVEDLLIYSGTLGVGGCVSELCGDVDECALGSHNCDANAICNNQAGGFSCSCLDGFTGDGVTCSGGQSTAVGMEAPAEGYEGDGETDSEPVFDLDYLIEEDDEEEGVAVVEGADSNAEEEVTEGVNVTEEGPGEPEEVTEEDEEEVTVGDKEETTDEDEEEESDANTAETDDNDDDSEEPSSPALSVGGVGEEAANVSASAGSEEPKAPSKSLLLGLVVTAASVLAAAVALLLVRELRRRRRQAAVVAKMQSPQGGMKAECVFAAEVAELQEIAGEELDLEKGGAAPAELRDALAQPQPEP